MKTLLYHDAISCDLTILIPIAAIVALTCHLSLFAASSFDDVLALAAPYGLLRHLEKSIVINWMMISNLTISKKCMLKKSIGT